MAYKFYMLLLGEGKTKAKVTATDIWYIKITSR